MNLLKDDFISTTEGKVSLKTLLTSGHDYQLQYYFDETQLAMLQLLGSLTTVVLKPSLIELANYLSEGVSEAQYEEALSNVDLQWFEDSWFMRSKAAPDAKVFGADICKLVSGIESSGTGNASGLFSEMVAVSDICSDCTHVLNYNLHMNIKGDCFGSSGATGIRGGGAISTLVAGSDLRTTILANTIAIDYFEKNAQLDEPECRVMWDQQITGDFYSAQKIGLERGLFALVYHIDFPVIDEPCICDVCGHQSDVSVKRFLRVKYKGSYGSKKTGRDANAGLWLHPYTPQVVKEDGMYSACARDQNWQSWQEFSSYIIGKETDKSSVKPALIIRQYRELSSDPVNFLVGGNIADQASIIGRVYDLYAMPASLNKYLSRVTQVIDTGLIEKENLSRAFNKMFGVGYDKNFVGGIKEQAMNRFLSNAQQIIQQILLDVNRKDAGALRRSAVSQLNTEAKHIYAEVLRKYQHDLPLFKALVKGERELLKVDNN